MPIKKTLPPLYFLQKELPSIAYISSKEKEEWGFVQFPSLARLPDGNLILHIHVAEDSVESYGKASFKYFISRDNGAHWEETGKNQITQNSLLLEDGSYLSVETVEAPKTSSLQLPKKPFTWIPYDYTYSQPGKAYRFDDLPESSKTIAIRNSKESQPKLAPISLTNDIRFDVEDLLPMIFFGPLKRAPDGGILGVFYPSSAIDETGRVDTKCGVLIAHSTDRGNNWKQLDRLPYTPDLEYDPKAYLRGGFTEPCAEILTDGSLLIIMRTADATAEMYPSFRECGPLYSVKRSIKGEWTKPVPISPFGVSPQLLRLKSNILVLSYGRPGIHVRFSIDEGETWSAPHPILEPLFQDPRAETCGYSSIVEDPNDPHAFLIGYSHFRHETPEKTLRKAILVQHCKIQGPFPQPTTAADITDQPEEIIEHYFPGTNTLSTRIRLKQNQAHGLTEGFYENGAVSFQSPYHEGKLHGLQRFFDPKGRLMQTIPFDNGNIHGIPRFFDANENIVKERFFWNDESCPGNEYQKYLGLL